MNRRAGAPGFTLVELLIALTLIGLLTTLIFSGLRLAAQAWSRVDDRAGNAADLWAVADVLRQAISAADPAYASADPSDRSIAFEGEADSLLLSAPLPRAIGAGVPAQLRFSVDAAGDRPPALVMAWRLDLPAASGDGPLPANRLILLDHVRAIRFAYFGPGPSGGAPFWQREWTSRSRLPGLVRIEIERDRPGLPDWPPFTVEPMAAANSACRYDAVTLGCSRPR
jgi:general secretion pathway protein J